MGWVLRSVFPWVSFHFCSTVSLRLIFMSLRVRRVFFYSIFVFINSFPSGFFSVSKVVPVSLLELARLPPLAPQLVPTKEPTRKAMQAQMYLGSGKQSISLISQVVAGLRSAHHWPEPTWQQNSVRGCCASRSACSPSLHRHPSGGYEQPQGWPGW